MYQIFESPDEEISPVFYRGSMLPKAGDLWQMYTNKSLFLYDYSLDVWGVATRVMGQQKIEPNEVVLIVSSNANEEIEHIKKESIQSSPTIFPNDKDVILFWDWKIKLDVLHRERVYKGQWMPLRNWMESLKKVK